MRSNDESPILLDRGMKDDKVKALLGILKIHDEDSYLRSIEVANIVALCIQEIEARRECEWNEEEKFEIVKGALLHDIGNAFIPLGIQNSSKKLDVYEIEVIRTHPIIGFVVLKEAEFSEIVKNIALLHHALADGSGYPVNLETRAPYLQETVPNYVWLVAYADKFEAMVSQRKFKASKSYIEAWNELNRMRINGKLPYKFAKYLSAVVKELSLFDVDGFDG